MRMFAVTRRSFLAIAVCAFMFTLAASSNMLAQPCRCDHITVRNNTACVVQLLFAAPLCKFAPVNVKPGMTVQVPCCDDLQVTIGCGPASFTFSGTGPLCYNNVPVGAPGGSPCCANACLSLDRAGCPLITIDPSGQPCFAPAGC